MSEIGANEIEVKAEVQDVADWFLLKEHMSDKKIQKLCYYAEAWSLAKLDQSIAVDSDFEAWVHGPVNRKLYDKFKQFGWKKLKINEEDLSMVKERLSKVFTEEQNDLLSAVWDTYGEFSADELETLTHREKPWLEKRKGLGKFDNCNKIIDKQTMKEYYQSIAIE